MIEWHQRGGITRRWILSMMMIGLVCLTGDDEAVAHPYHICVGQMEWNSESKVWEVSLCLHPQDLERAMKQWRLASVKQPLSDSQLVELQKGCSAEDPEFEKTIPEFLQGEFYFLALPKDSRLTDAKERIENKDGKSPVSRMKWVGKETEKGWLWLHFEVTPPKLDRENPELWIVNKILIDVVDKQENSLAVRWSPTEKVSYEFKKGEIAHHMAEVASRVPGK